MRTILLKVVNISCVIIITVFLTQCTKDDALDLHSSANTTDNPSLNNFITCDYNSAMEKIAKELAVALKDTEFRRLFKEEVMKRFDGDYDVLYLNFKEKVLGGSNLKVKQLIENGVQQNSEGILKAGSSQDALIVTHVIKYGNLQFSIPIHAEEWDYENFHPTVVYKPYRYSDDNFSYVKGFDQNGDEVTVSNKMDPGVPIIVVGHCERTDIYGNLYNEYKEGFEYPRHNSRNVISQNNIDMYLNQSTLKIDGEGPDFPPSNLRTSSPNSLDIELQWNDNSTNETGFSIYRYGPNEAWHYLASVGADTRVFTDIGSTTYPIQHGKLYKYYIRAVTPNGETAHCDPQGEYGSSRYAGSDIYIQAFKFNNIGSYEGILDGAPEIRCSMAYGNASSQDFEFEDRLYKPDQRRDVDDRWWNCNFHLTDWMQSADKYCYTLHFYEDDWVDFAEGDFWVNVSYAQKLNSGDVNVAIGGSLAIHVDSKNNDKVIGTIIVKWWDETNKQYNVGGLDVKIGDHTI